MEHKKIRVGKLAGELAKVDMTLPVSIHENSLFFRQSLADGTATLPDGRAMEIDASVNINRDALLIGLTVKGGKGWHTYVFSTKTLIQHTLADFETRFPKP